MAKRIWNVENGLLCLVSQYDTDDWVVNVPNPNFTSSNHQFLEVEGFHYQSDAIDYAIANYGADTNGCVSLLYVMNDTKSSISSLVSILQSAFPDGIPPHVYFCLIAIFLENDLPEAVIALASLESHRI